jgi:hypothetical protein
VNRPQTERSQISVQAADDGAAWASARRLRWFQTIGPCRSARLRTARRTHAHRAQRPRLLMPARMHAARKDTAVAGNPAACLLAVATLVAACSSGGRSPSVWDKMAPLPAVQIAQRIGCTNYSENKDAARTNR